MVPIWKYKGQTFQLKKNIIKGVDFDRIDTGSQPYYRWYGTIQMVHVTYEKNDYIFNSIIDKTIKPMKLWTNMLKSVSSQKMYVA